MYLVFDVGGTHTRIGLSADGKTLAQVERYDTDITAGGFDRLCKQLSHWAKQHSVSVVAGGIPGHTEAATGRLVHLPNMPAWQGLPALQRLEDALGVSVKLDNDAAVVGLGEAVHGAGRGYDLVVYVTVSTGVNGVRVVHGAIDRSAQGFELGAQLLTDPRGRLVSLESLIGGASLAQRYHQPPARLHEAGLWAAEARYLAVGLYNSLLHWSPDVVVLGGSMMRDVHVAAVARELAQLPPVYDSWPPLKLAELGDDGGLYGALALAVASN